MADDTNDVLMKFVINDGDSGIDAECQTELDWKDDLMWDFDNGQFFEVLEFGFGMNLADDEGGDAQESGKGVAGAALSAASMASSRVMTGSGLSAGGLAGAALGAAARFTQRAGGGAQGAAASGKGAGGQFQRWKSMLPGQVFDPPYRVKMDEFNFTRYLDKASPVLFERCCNSQSFASATLIKRKVTGAAKLQAFLRIDFDKVLITKLDWEDGEVIKEKCNLVFRGLKVQYMRQHAHGGLEKARMPVEWQYTLDLVDAAEDD